MDKEGAMAVTYKEDGSRSGKRAAIYRGVAEQVGHGISRSREIRGVTDRGQGSGMKTQNRTAVSTYLQELEPACNLHETLPIHLPTYAR